MFKFILIYCWSALWINTPYIMISLLAQALVLLSCLVGSSSNIIGFIIFLLYVGGLMILVSYCVMMTPVGNWGFIFLLPFIFALSSSSLESFSLGLILSMSILFLVGLLLFIVLISAVDIVNYSAGILNWL